MKILKEFPFTPDKERIFSAIDCTCDNPFYYKASLCFEQALEKFFFAISPRAAYYFEKKIEILDFLPNCSREIYVLYTLGSQISDTVSECFKEGGYFDGMLLSAMADVYLFQMQEWLYEYLEKLCRAKGLQVSPCFTPLDNIAPEYQLRIVNKLPLGVTLTPAFMLQPVKSASFILGAGSSPADWSCERTHSCENCHLPFCRYRKAPRFDDLPINM